jgi:hypothetical protein
MKRVIIGLATLMLLCRGGHGQAIWDVVADWSDQANPNGPWRYCENANHLPHVAAWESQLNWQSFDQPGWAESENGNNRLPFWFRVVPENTPGVNWEPGDVIVHTTDGTNGVGNGDATLVWESPVSGMVDIIGGLWFCRDIGRSVQWSLSLDGALLAAGSLWSGDPYDREHLQRLSDQEVEPGQLSALPVSVGQQLRLVLQTTSTWGDFVGVRLLVQVSESLGAPHIESIALEVGEVLIDVGGLAAGADHWMQVATSMGGPWEEYLIPVLEGASQARYREPCLPGDELRVYRAVSRRP